MGYNGIVEDSSILTLFGSFLDELGPWGREALGTHFRTLFATLGPKSPNDPCSGQTFSQHKRAFTLSLGVQTGFCSILAIGSSWLSQPQWCEHPFVQYLGAHLAIFFAWCRGHLGPLGPKSKKSQNEVRIDYLSTFWTLFRLFRPPGREAPGFFSTLGPKGPNDPCSRRGRSQRSPKSSHEDLQRLF